MDQANFRRKLLEISNAIDDLAAAATHEQLIAIQARTMEISRETARLKQRRMQGAPEKLEINRQSVGI